MRRSIAAVLTVPLLLAGCGGEEPAAQAPAPTKPKVFQVTGSFGLGLPDFEWVEDPPSCSGRGGYDDLTKGAQVVVTDAAGTTVGVGSITETEPITERESVEAARRAVSCVFRFQVLNVPAGKGFYGVEVTRRGRVQYAEADFAKPLELTIGS